VAQTTFHFTITPTTGLTGTPASGADTCTTDASGTCQFKVASKVADQSYTVHGAISTNTPFEDVNGSPLTIIFKPGPLDMSRSTLRVVDNSAKAGGGQNSVQIKLVDTNNNPITTANTVTFSAVPGIPFGGTALFGTQTTGGCNIATAGTNAGQCPNPVTLTSQTADSYVVTAQVGQETSNPVTVVFTTGAADPAQSLIDYAKDTAGQPITSQPADSVTPLIVVATAKDANGILLPNVDFTFKVTPTSGLVGPAASGTGTCRTISLVGDPAYGTCQFPLTSKSPGDYSVTATISASGTATEVTNSPLTVSFFSIVDAANSTLVVKPDHALADGSETDVITVTLRDAHGNQVLLNGVKVTFAAADTKGGGPGVFRNAINQCTTGLDGTCFVELTSTTPTVYDVSVVQVDAVALSNGPLAQATFDPAVCPTCSSIDVTPDHQPADGYSTDKALLTLKDNNGAGNLLIGVPATVYVQQPGAELSLYPSTDPRAVWGATATCPATDAQGQCSFYVRSSTSGSYALGLVDPLTNPLLLAAANFNEVKYVSLDESNLGMATNNQPADGSAPDIAQVTLFYNQVPVSGVAVTFTVATGATLLETRCITTDAGACTARITSNIPGKYAVTAGFVALDSTGKLTTMTLPVPPKVVNAVFTGPPDQGNSTLVVDPDRQSANGQSADRATVTAKDADGNPTPGWTVNFTAAPAGALFGPAYAGGTTTATCTTNSEGQCSVYLTSEREGTYQVTAAVDTVTLTAGATFIPVCTQQITTDCGADKADHGVLIIDPNNQPADNIAQDRANVALLDANDRQVQNAWVTFSVTGSPAVTFSPAPSANGQNDGNQCQSDANGECSVSLRSTQPGDFTVSVTAPLTKTPIDSEIATFKPVCTAPNTPPGCVSSYVPDQLTFVIDPNDQPANGVSEDGVAITLFDSKSRHVVPNTRVFLETESGARLTSTFCDTDANGVCYDTTGHKAGVTSQTAGGYTVTTTVQMPDPALVKTAVARFCDPTDPTLTACDSTEPVTQNSTLAVTQDNQSADGASPDEVKATLADASQRPVKNARVTFNVQPGARLLSTTCITGDGTNGTTAGACNQDITSFVAGQYTVSVTGPIPTTPPAVTVTFVTPDLDQTQSSLSILHDYQPADGTSAVQAEFLANDKNGRPLKDIPVTFNADPAGVTFSSRTCTTGVNGTCAVALTSTAPGEYTIAATSGQVQETAKAHFTGDITKIVLMTTSDGNSANGQSEDEVTATAFDKNDYPVSQQDITFTVQTGARFGLYTNGKSTATCTTQNGGTCVVGVTSLAAGSYQVNTTAPVVAVAPATVTFIRVCTSATDTNCGSGPIDPGHSYLTVVHDNMPANGYSQNVVGLTARDSIDLQVKNVPVTFAVNPADAKLATGGICKTDNNGLCDMGVTSEQEGPYSVNTTDPVALNAVTVTFICSTLTQPNNPACLGVPTYATLTTPVNGMPANGISQDFVEAKVYDENKKLLPGIPTTFEVDSRVTLAAPGQCRTGDGTLGTAMGICRMGMTSLVDGINFPVGLSSLDLMDLTLLTAPPKTTVTFIRLCTSATDTNCGAGPPDPKNSTLIVDPNHQPADGKRQDLAAATLKDQYQLPVPSVQVVFDIQAGAFLVQAGTTLPAQECTTDSRQGVGATGACSMGITSTRVGDYTVSTSAPISMTATASFGGLGTVIPGCAASTKQALPGQTVRVTCAGGTPGDKVVIPGTNCNPATISPSGDLTCVGNASDMGNNPPIVVTNPNTGTNTGILDFQVIDGGNNGPLPPPVPSCVASPNPAMPGQKVTLTCTNGVPGDIVQIIGTDCDPATIPPTGLLSCQGSASDLGSNPVITVTDPSSDLSNSSVIPLEVYLETDPPLPDCVASPNPAKAGQPVTVTCDNGKPGTQVTVPGTDCKATQIPASGSLTCQGDAGDMGTNPPITVIDPDTGGSSDGVIPLEVDPTSNPPLPDCKASPKQAQPSDQVTASCENGKPGTTITIPGTDCNGKPIPPSGSLTCSGTASQMGSNPPITIIDPTGGSSKGVLPLEVGSSTNPPLPDCVASPNPAKAGQSVTVTCDNGKPGTQVTVPGTDCNATQIPSSGSLTCQGDAGNMGTNPPITVIDPDTGGSSGGVIPLEVDPTSNPPLPDCKAEPKQALPSDRVTASCQNAKPGTTITIPGTDCNGKRVPPSGSLLCTGDASAMGSNPPITVIDPTGGSSKGVLPLEVLTKPVYPKLPDCVAEPNPVAPGQPVTITCQNGEPGTQVTVPGTNCDATVIPGSGTLSCTASDSSDLGNNPVIKVTDPVTDVTSEGTIPLVVEPVTTPSDALSVLNIMDDNRPADGIAQDTAEVLLLNANGDPISNTVVTFKAAVGATLVNETCRTSAYGACRVGLTATVPGSYAVEVIAPVKIGPAMATFVGAVSQADSTLFMAVNNMPANGASENRAQVTLRDRNGNPVAGEEVAFEVTSGALFTSNGQLIAVKRATPGAPSPVTPSEQVTCTTDTQGMCTVGLTSSAPGTYQINTTSPVALGPVKATFVQPVPGAPDAGHSALVIGTDGATANGLSQDIAIVTLHDANDVPVSNVVVAFTVDAGATLVDAACRTDVDGMCEVGLTSTTAGKYGVTAQAGTLTLGPKQATFIAVCTPTITTNCGAAAPDAGKSKIEVLPPNNAQANGKERDIVQVTLHDANNQAVSSVQVTLTSGAGSTLVSTTCLTDVSGMCTVEVTSTAPGAYLVETTAPIAIGPVAARFVAASPSNTVISTPTLDPRVLFGLMVLLAMVALRVMRASMH
jgi:hypothetical protein